MQTRAEKRHAYYVANREVILAKARIARKSPQAKAAADRAKRVYVERNRDKVRAGKRRRNGMPEPTRPEPTVCECCGNPPGKKGMCLDHCHLTGEFRGWLCGLCNTAIGKLGDCVAGLQRAIRYLERFESVAYV